MPIETPQGTLDIENAKLRASEIIATASVGIGTTESNQSYPLQIFKETGPDIRIQEGATSSSAARLYSNNSNLYIQTGTNFTTGSSGDIAFQTMEGQSTHMIVKSDGKVGVGTGSPGSKLHVYDGTATSLIVEGGNNTIGTDTAQIILRNKIARRAGLEFQDDSDNSRIWHIGRRYVSGGASTKLSFSNVNDDEVMTITNAGNVGIGTNSPGNKLHIQGDSAVVTSDPSVNNYGQIEISSSSYAGWTNADRPTNLKIGIDHTVGTLGAGFIQGVVDYIQAGVPLLLCPGGGNVGIGTTSPLAGLHVQENTIMPTSSSHYETGTVYKDNGNNTTSQTKNYYSVAIGNGYNQFQIIFTGYARNYQGNGNTDNWRRQYTVWRNLNSDATIIHDTSQDLDASGWSFGTSLSGSSTGTQTVYFEVTTPPKADGATYITFCAEVLAQSTSIAGSATKIS